MAHQSNATVWRRRPRLTLRLAGLLCIPLAAAFTWIGSEYRVARKQARSLAIAQAESVELVPCGEVWESIRRSLPDVVSRDTGGTCFSRVVGFRVPGFITDEQLAACGQFSALKWLELAAPVESTPSGWRHLTDLRQLRRLTVDCSCCDEDIVRAVLELDQLEVLDLHVGNCGSALARLQRFNNLRELSISFWSPYGMDDRSVELRHIRIPPNVTNLSLSIGDGEQSLGNELDVAFTCFDRLETLHLVGASSMYGTSVFTRNAFRLIARFVNLECLDIGRTGADDSDIDCLLALTRLRYICLRDTRVSQYGVLTLARSLPDLTEIDHSAVCTPEVAMEIDTLLMSRRK